MLTNWHEIADELGPAQVVFLHNPILHFKAIVAVDNVARGAAIGGVRMSPSADAGEVIRLARAMTLKSAVAGLPHGGAKAAVIADPKMSPIDKERLIRGFARAIADIADFIPGPDMGTDERSMAFIYDEIGRAVGLPRVLGGIPLDEIGATGFGLAVCAEAAKGFAGIELSGARVAVQGFGAVGINAARFLADRGAVIVAVADSRGAIVNLEGLDVGELIEHKRSGRSVRDFSRGKAIAGSELVGVPCEIWVPAAQADVIDKSNAGALKAKVVLCGANIPITEAAEAALHARGVLVVPDFVANAGGLICASVEYRGGTQAQALAVIEETIAANTSELLERARRDRIAPRRAALEMARARVREAMSYRRHGLRQLPRGADLLDM